MVLRNAPLIVDNNSLFCCTLNSIHPLAHIGFAHICVLLLITTLPAHPSATAFTFSLVGNTRVSVLNPPPALGVITVIHIMKFRSIIYIRVCFYAVLRVMLDHFQQLVHGNSC